MNTGEQLVSLSGLSSGSALAHLLAIQTGTGESFYSGTVRVVTSQPEVFVHRKEKRSSIEQERTVPRASSPQKKSSRIGAAYVFAPQKAAYSFTQPDELFVLVRSTNETTVMTATNSVIATKKAN